MDTNTRDVLMSVLEIVSIVVIGLMAVYQVRANRKMDNMRNKVEDVNNKVDNVNHKVEVVDSKLDENHKQMNGNFTKLLQTTEELATAKGKALGKEEAKEESKK